MEEEEDEEEVVAHEKRRKRMAEGRARRRRRSCVPPSLVSSNDGKREAGSPRQIPPGWDLRDEKGQEAFFACLRELFDVARRAA